MPGQQKELGKCVWPRLQVFPKTPRCDLAHQKIPSRDLRDSKEAHSNLPGHYSQLGKSAALPEHLWREVSKCDEEISQQAINTRTVEWLAQFVMVENHLQGIEDPSPFYQQNSAVPAIVIKRHCLLVYWYDTWVIFNQCTRHPAPPRDQEVDKMTMTTKIYLGPMSTCTLTYLR